MDIPQCVVDDSGSHAGSPVFVMGGFIASHERWAAFADDWQASLDKPPRLDYFKMSEALRMHEQFDKRRGWTEPLRDERLAEFAGIAANYAQVRVTASIRNEDWTRYIANLPSIARRFSVDNPMVMLATQIILAVAVFGDRHGIDEPCEYYFDDNEALRVEMNGYWETFKWQVSNSAKSDLARFIGGPPSFRDEKAFLPLQAADLYASLARQHITRNRVLVVPPSVTLRKFASLGHINREYSTAELQRLREHLLRVGEHFAREFPDTRLVPPIKNKRERRKAYKAARKSMTKPPSQERSS